MKETGYKAYGMASGIFMVLYVISGFFWAQAAYAMLTIQGVATLLLGAAYFLCGVKCSLLVPAENPEGEPENAASEGAPRQYKLA